jgi:hypothetical protein
MQTRRSSLPNQGDADLTVAPRDLPAAPGQTVVFCPINVGPLSPFAEFPRSMEAIISIPSLNSTQLPDGSALTITISSAEALVPPAEPVPGLLMVLDPASEAAIATLEITGADGAGAPAQELRVALWTQPHRRYVGAKVTSGDGVGDLSALWGHFQIVG